VAEAGAQLTEDAGKSFAGIATMLRQTSELAQAISLAARQQVTGTDAVAATMQTIAAGAQENAAKGRQAAKAVEQLLRTSEQLAQPLGQLRSVAGPAVVKPEKSEAAKPEKSEAPTPVTHN
jgi:methyl-accepting chemotaxis protein